MAPTARTTPNGGNLLGVSIPSEAEYAAGTAGGGTDFSLLPADDYVIEVQTLTVQPGKLDIFDKPKPGEPQRTYDGLEVRFRPISFANGDEVQDENGDDIPENRDPLFFDWFDPEKVGLKPQASKARKFFAAASGVELEDRIDIEDFQTLVGKRMLATVIIKTNAAGKRSNRITDYRLIRQRRRAAAAADPVAAAAAKVAPAGPLPNMVEAAKEVFADNLVDDDLPF